VNRPIRAQTESMTRSEAVGPPMSRHRTDLRTPAMRYEPSRERNGVYRESGKHSGSELRIGVLRPGSATTRLANIRRRQPHREPVTACRGASDARPNGFERHSADESVRPGVTDRRRGDRRPVTLEETACPSLSTVLVARKRLSSRARFGACWSLGRTRPPDHPKRSLGRAS
jgi:hypothetical protein